LDTKSKWLCFGLTLHRAKIRLTIDETDEAAILNNGSGR